MRGLAPERPEYHGRGRRSALCRRQRRGASLPPRAKAASAGHQFPFASMRLRRHAPASKNKPRAKRGRGTEGVGHGTASDGDRRARGEHGPGGGFRVGDGRAARARARARSASSPGPATSSAARPTRRYDWVTGFETETGCKVNVKTAGTSDEMVALMNEGGFDLVTASGDASLRLIAGKKVQEINTGPDPVLGHGRPAAAERALAHGRRQALRRALPVGPERADVQHRGVQGARRPRGTWCSRRQTLPDGKSNKGRVQAFDGPIYIADAALYLMAHKPELGHQGPLRADRGPVPGGARPAAAAAPDRAPLLARRHDAGRRLHQRGRGRLGLVAVPGQPAARARARRSPARSRPRGPPAGPTPPCCTPTPSTRTAPTCGWSTRSRPRCRATSPPGSARCPSVPAACKGNELLTDEGCATNGIDNFEQDPLLAHAGRQVRDARPPAACPTIAGSPTTSPSSAAGDGAG